MKEQKKYKIIIDADKVIHKMKGGMGASWHSLSREIPLENEKYDYPVRLINPRGSAYGGNPPVEDFEAWQQIYDHAKWLGLNFIRVELSQHMYEPEREVFDWHNEEMLALCMILDWCEENGADVFLQQMWGHVEWNAYPGVHPLLSAPCSLDDFANGISTLLDYLINTLGYTCIKYFCIVNEPPGGTWGYWWCYGMGSGSVTDALKKVRESLDMKGIGVPISGPDWTSMPPFDSSKIDFDNFIGAYDIHSYFGITPEDEQELKKWVEWAHSKDKPFFLTELGNMNLGWGNDDPGPKSFEAALSNASDIIKGINLGVDAFNRWSFTNRGDLDGQWQLIKTWDIKGKKYIEKVIPEKEAYYGYAMLTRFIGKYASVLNICNNQNFEGISAAALRSKDRSISIIILNQNDEEVKTEMSLLNIEEKKDFYFYQISKETLSAEDFKLESQSNILEFREKFLITLLPQSITVLTHYNLRHDDSGVIV